MHDSQVIDQWHREKLKAVPGALRERVRRMHENKFKAAKAVEDFQAANLWLQQTAERMKGIKVPTALTDSELCEIADKCARECLDMAGERVGLMGIEGLRKRMGLYCNKYGIQPPGETVEDSPAVSRMTCHLWWRRQLRKTQARALEAESINLGFVHRKAEIYASDLTVERRAQQRKRNAQVLENTEAVNMDTGEIYNLGELAEKSVANPRIRRGELMTRIKGFEHIAQGLGHAAEFVTVTCPSKYHPKKTEGFKVVDNPKYCGATPREAQGYLTKTWAKIRAKLARIGARIYGFRITEAHHDGCPHWHMLLFMNAVYVEIVRAVIRDYALQEDGHEAGAQKNRVDFKAIDPAKGTAAGYIAKYVSKNIDGGGYQVQGDIEADSDSVTTGHRIEAWASTWGIRQFQQIGGPPVGVWRELRRMQESKDHTDTIESARVAADIGNWRRFVEVMGGPTVARKYRPLKVAYTKEGERWSYFDQCHYPAPITRYGETAPGAVFGVADILKNRVFQSPRYRWEIKRKVKNGNTGLSLDGGILGRKQGSFSSVYGRTQHNAGGGRGNDSGLQNAGGINGNQKQNAHQKGAGAYAFQQGQPKAKNENGLGFESVVGFQGRGEALAPWTRVNNCTQGENFGRNENGFEKKGNESANAGMGKSPSTHADNADWLRGPGYQDIGSNGQGTGRIETKH